MTLTYYDEDNNKQRRDSRVVTVMMVANAALSITALYWWTALSLLVAEPLKWATWHGVSFRPDIFDYPYVLMWSMPFLGICASWLAQKSGRMQLARFCGVYPIAFLALLVGWYYLTPVGWR